VKYVPGIAHEISLNCWTSSLVIILVALTGGPGFATHGCTLLGATSRSHNLRDSPLYAFFLFTLSPGKKEADTSIRPRGTYPPIVVVEVGDSESLGQMRTDARLWLESTILNVRQLYFLVVVIAQNNILRSNWLSFI